MKTPSHPKVKRATHDELAAALREPYFAQGQPAAVYHGNDMLPQADPVTPTQLSLALDEIEFYDGNPRLCRNARYQEIKHSIRARGLDTPLPVTRRPQAERYMIGKGGNTRLAILKELHEETGEQRFYRVECHFVPWVSEADVLVAHLAENDLRGELTFIDRALGVQALKRMIEQDDGVALSYRQLSKRLQALGYSQDAGSLTRMAYAVDTLWPSLPTALQAGMGRPQVDHLRRLDTAARTVWKGVGDVQPNDYHALWADVLRRNDAERLDVAAVRRALEGALARTAGADELAVARSLEAALEPTRLHDRKMPDSPDNPAEGAIPLLGGSETKDSDRDRAGQKARSVDESSEATAKTNANVIDRTSERSHDSDANPAVASGRATAPPNNAPGRSADADDTDTLDRLREGSWQLASGLAQDHYLEAAVSRTPQAFGYLVIDIPDASLNGVLPPDQLAGMHCLWWQLLACSGLAAAPPEIIAASLPEGSALREVYLKQNLKPLNGTVAGITPAHLAQQLWLTADDPTWRAMTNLMDTYRRIGVLSRELNVPLWTFKT